MSGLHLPGSVEIGISDNGDELAAKFDRARRNRIAEGFAFALVASEAHHINYIPSVAIDLADALIAELDK